jgi:hypothetical protein
MKRSTICAIAISLCLAAIGFAREPQEKRVNNKNIPASVTAGAAKAFSKSHNQGMVERNRRWKNVL